MNVHGINNELRDLCSFRQGYDNFSRRVETFKADDELGKENFNKEQQVEDF